MSLSFPPQMPAWQIEHESPPKLPNSYFWTWDHSCNWVLDEPGMQVSGCSNLYLKHPETFVEDYRRLTDLAAGLGVKGIVIFGFLRESHGGIDYAKRVTDYASSKGVAILPGVGTTCYGGVFYEGDHKYSLRNFLKENPDAAMLDKDGAPPRGGEAIVCLAHPLYREWLEEAIDWLFKEFDIGGVNIENGDFLVDYHPLFKAMRKEWPAADDPDVFVHQGLSYNQALTAMAGHLKDKLCVYATYTGFQYTEEASHSKGMGNKPPAMFKVLPEDGIAQWTLSGMLLHEPMPLASFLDDGAPAALYNNPNWPRGLKPPSKRSFGYLHQGSQWRSGAGRYGCVVSSIKEACLRAFEVGLEGISIHGEVTARHIPCALNYLAFSHFIHHPDDTLRDFGRRTLGQVLGSAELGEEFVELLARWDAGDITDELRQRASQAKHNFGSPIHDLHKHLAQHEYRRCCFWQWLHAAIHSPNSNRHETGMMV